MKTKDIRLTIRLTDQLNHKIDSICEITKISKPEIIRSSLEAVSTAFDRDHKLVFPLEIGDVTNINASKNIPKKSLIKNKSIGFNYNQANKRTVIPEDNLKLKL